jgi:hypothetical protein
VVEEVNDAVATGLWAGDCFIYTNGANRLNYYVGGEIVTVAHMDRSVKRSAAWRCWHWSGNPYSHGEPWW